MIAATNVAAYCAQAALLVLLCAGLPRLLRLASPVVHYAFWRALLVLCLVLPLVQPWYPSVATAAAAGTGDGAAKTISLLPGVEVTPRLRLESQYDLAAVAGMVIAAGMVVRMAWLTLGMLRLRRVRRGATARADGFEELQRAIGVAPDILWSGDVRHPVAFGLRSPVVLLPESLRNAGHEAQRAVVAHELHHVKRRDWVWLLGEELLRSVFWFHPAIWWLISRVQLSRETVVDELSILVTNARRTYIETLLTFAGTARVPSAPFSARRHLFHRVMLLSKEAGMSSTRVALSSGVLIAALGAGSVSAVSAFPLYTAPVPLPSVQDDQDAYRKLFEQLKTMQAELERRQPERGALMKTLEHDARTFDRLLADLQRQQAAKQTPPVPIPAAFQATLDRLNPIHLPADGVTPPRTLREVKPEYPAEARMQRVEGEVLVEAIIDTDGKVADARALKSVPLLEDAALSAMRQWEFEPTLLNGAAVAVICQVTMTFRIR